MWALSPGGARKGPKNVFEGLFLKKVCENIRTWVPPSRFV